MSAPLVSVVVPTLNGERYLTECVESALAQSLTDLEIVVTDDGSTDRTSVALARFRDPRLRVLAAAPSAGAAANWNRGLRAARGRYVKVLCQDDRLHPDCLREQAAALAAAPSSVLCASARRIVSASGKVLLPRVGGEPDARIGRDEVIRRCLRRGTNVLGEPSGLLLDRAAALRVGGFRAAGYVTDLDMWLRLLACGDAVLLARPLVDFRVHEQSWSARLRGEQPGQTRALLRAAAGAAGVRVGGNLHARTTRRWIGRSVIYGVSRVGRSSKELPA